MTYWEAKRILRQQAALVSAYPAAVLAEAQAIVDDVEHDKEDSR